MTSASRDELRLRHLLPAHEGLEVEYTIAVDGQPQPLPAALARRRFYGRFATEWTHSWDARGLLTTQVLPARSEFEENAATAPSS